MHPHTKNILIINAQKEGVKVMSFRDGTHWHIPDKYRDSEMYSKDFFKIWFLMPALMILGCIIAPFATESTNIRPMYSELYVCAYAVDTVENEIPMQCKFGTFYDDERKPFEFSVESNGDTQILCVKNVDEPIQEKMPESINIHIPITDSTTQIVLQQRNGLKQLIFEKNKNTGKWESASDGAQFMFFAKNHTLNCVVLCFLFLVFIALLIIPIVLITRKRRIKKYKEKDPFLDEL